MRLRFFGGQLLLVLVLAACSQKDHMEEAKRLINDERYSAAIPELSDHIARHPDDIEAFRMRYRCYYKTADYGNAKTDLDNLKRLGENSADLYNLYGNIFYKMHNLDSAIFNFRKAYALDRKLYTLNYNIALIYYQELKQDSAALVYLNLEILTYPRELPARLMKADILNSIQRYTEAISQADTVLLMDTTRADAWCEKGIAYFNLAKWDSSVLSYSGAIKFSSRDPDYYTRRASAYSKQENFPLAIADATTAVSLDPRRVDAYRLRAFCYKQLHKNDSVCNDIKKIREIDARANVDDLTSGLDCH